MAGLTAVSMQVRCIDAAREAARLAARGDSVGAQRIVADIAPAGSTLEVRHDGGFVVASVTATSAVLPMVSITADAVSAPEPAGR